MRLKPIFIIVCIFAFCYQSSFGGSVFIEGYEYSKSNVNEFRGMPEPSVSPIGKCRLYYDSTADKLKLSENGGSYSDIGGGSASPGGSNTQIQFNSSSAFAGDSGLTYDTAVSSITLSGLFGARDIKATYGINSPTATFTSSHTSANSCLDIDYTRPAPPEDDHASIRFLDNNVGYLMLFGGDTNSGLWQCGTAEGNRNLYFTADGTDIFGWGQAASGAAWDYKHFYATTRAVFKVSADLKDVGVNYCTRLKSDSTTELSADRDLTIDVDNGARTVKLQGNLTVESASVLNQDLTTDNNPTFDGGIFTNDVDILNTTIRTLHLDNTTTGSSANSPIIKLGGNYWQSPPGVDVETYFTWQTILDSGNLKLSFGYNGVERAYLEGAGDFYLDGDLAVNGDNINCDGDLTIDAAGDDIILGDNNRIRHADTTDHFLELYNNDDDTGWYWADTYNQLQLKIDNTIHLLIESSKVQASLGFTIGGWQDDRWLDDATHGTGTTTCYIGTHTIDTTAPSDERFKKNIINTKYGLTDLLAIEIKDFQYKKELMTDDITVHTGIIAQELQEIYPYAVNDRPWGEIEVECSEKEAKDEKGKVKEKYREKDKKYYRLEPEYQSRLSVDYKRLIPLMIKSIQTLNAKVEENEKEIARLKNKNAGFVSIELILGLIAAMMLILFGKKIKRSCGL